MSDKPWREQRWEVGAPGPCGGRIVRVEANGDRTIIADECEDDAEKAFAAAPDMAMALKGIGSKAWYADVLQWHIDACREGILKGRTCLSECANARAALAKAGVP